MEEAGATVEFLDRHVPELPVMREYGQFHARPVITLDAIAGVGIDAVLIDTRKAIASRDLPLDGVTKA